MAVIAGSTRDSSARAAERLAIVNALRSGLDKSSQTSTWSHRPLDTDQLSYAALDAKVLLALHERFTTLGVAATDTKGEH